MNVRHVLPEHGCYQATLYPDEKWSDHRGSNPGLSLGKALRCPYAMAARLEPRRGVEPHAVTFVASPPVPPDGA